MEQWRPDFAAGRRLYAPFVAAARPFVAGAAWPTLAEYNAAAAERGLTTARGVPVRFVAAAKKRRARGQRTAPPSPSYDERIDMLGEVSTRLGSWHDFFNVLSWLTYPRAKAALNRRQIEAHVGPGRCHEQSRLAILDEGGVAVLGGERLVFGHALCEAAIRGETFVHGMACVLPAALPVEATLAERVAAADAALAEAIASRLFAGSARFATVPLAELL